MPDKEYHPTDIIVERKRLGRHKADGRALQANKIIQVDTRLDGTHYLDVIIHECLHILLPYLTEEVVNSTASQIASVVDQQMEVTKRKKPK